MWPRLRAPVYATKFAIGLLETAACRRPNAPKIDLREIAPRQRLKIGPFEIEYMPVAHSIPESNALAIRTAAGSGRAYRRLEARSTRPISAA